MANDSNGIDGHTHNWSPLPCMLVAICVIAWERQPYLAPQNLRGLETLLLSGLKQTEPSHLTTDKFGTNMR